jgi:hypothetical protein
MGEKMSDDDIMNMIKYGIFVVMVKLKGIYRVVC